MLEGVQAREDRARTEAAARVCGLVYGVRDKKPKLGRLFRSLAGTRERDTESRRLQIREQYAEMIAESKERVRKQRLVDAARKERA